MEGVRRPPGSLLLDRRPRTFHAGSLGNRLGAAADQSSLLQRGLGGSVGGPGRLGKVNVVPLDFEGRPAEEPVVLAWMPAAALYFTDPDGNLFEFISMLPDPPRPDLGVVSWSEWRRVHSAPA